MRRLKEKVAVITGASRNAGRGIAFVLGEEGATVYVTGRSVRGNQTAQWPEVASEDTIQDTAEQVTKRGGVGIPVQCDHSVDEQVEALFDRVKQEQGRLDILVNNAWGGYRDVDETWGNPFWEQPFWRWDVMFTVGVRSNMVSSYFAVPLMLPHRQGFIVHTLAPMQYEHPVGRAPLSYYLRGNAIDRMAHGMAEELRPYNIAVVALGIGWLRTRYILHESKTDDLNAYKVGDLWQTQSTQYVGRAVVALATDPDLMQKTGQLHRTGDLGREYGFTDIDGRHPGEPA